MILDKLNARWHTRESHSRIREFGSRDLGATTSERVFRIGGVAGSVPTALVPAPRGSHVGAACEVGGRILTPS